MPFFRFLIEVYDDCPRPSGADETFVAGGYTTRFARGKSVGEALDKIVMNISGELEAAGLKRLDKYRKSDGAKVSLLTYVRRAPGRGFTFYSEAEHG